MSDLLPRFTPLPPAPERTDQGEEFAAISDTFFDSFPPMVNEFNNSILPALEDLSLNAALEAAQEVSGMYDPNNYYTKTAMDAFLAALAAATTAQVWAGTDASHTLTPANLFAAAASVAKADGSTITLDFSAGFNFNIAALGGNRTLANPSTPKPGQTGVIVVVQDATGNRTLAYGSSWKFPSGAPTLSTAANSVDIISYYVLTTSFIICTLTRNFL